VTNGAANTTKPPADPIIDTEHWLAISSFKQSEQFRCHICGPEHLSKPPACTGGDTARMTVSDDKSRAHTEATEELTLPVECGEIPSPSNDPDRGGRR
jgi:hypothetical protein